MMDTKSNRYYQSHQNRTEHVSLCFWKKRNQISDPLRIPIEQNEAE